MGDPKRHVSGAMINFSGMKPPTRHHKDATTPRKGQGPSSIRPNVGNSQRLMVTELLELGLGLRMVHLQVSLELGWLSLTAVELVHFVSFFKAWLAAILAAYFLPSFCINHFAAANPFSFLLAVCQAFASLGLCFKKWVLCLDHTDCFQRASRIFQILCCLVLIHFCFLSCNLPFFKVVGNIHIFSPNGSESRWFTTVESWHFLLVKPGLALLKMMIFLFCQVGYISSLEGI